MEYKPSKKDLNELKLKAYEIIEKCLYELDDYSCAMLGFIVCDDSIDNFNINNILKKSMSLTFTVRLTHDMYRTIIVEYGDMTDEIKKVLTHTYNIRDFELTKEDLSFERKVKKYITGFLFNKEDPLTKIPNFKWKVLDEYQKYVDKMYTYEDGDYYYKYLNSWNQNVVKIKINTSQLDKLGKSIFYLLNNDYYCATRLILTVSTQLAESQHYTVNKLLIEHSAFADSKNYVLKLINDLPKEIKNPSPYDFFFDDSRMEYVDNFVENVQSAIDNMIDLGRKVSSNETILFMEYNIKEIPDNKILDLLHKFNIKVDLGGN